MQGLCGEEKGITMKLDMETTLTAIKKFNSDRFLVANDWLIYHHFSSLEKTLEPSTIESRVLILDKLWRTQLDKRKGDSQAIADSLRSHRKEILEALSGLKKNPACDEIVEIGVKVLPFIVHPNDDARNNYSFGTKFLHWSTGGLLPIVDSRARQSIVDRQAQWNVQPENKIKPNRDDHYLTDYEKWIRLYCQIDESLTDKERVRLMKTDSDIPAEYRLERGNSLFRILDKAFYVWGDKVASL